MSRSLTIPSWNGNDSKPTYGIEVEMLPGGSVTLYADSRYLAYEVHNGTTVHFLPIGIVNGRAIFLNQFNGATSTFSNGTTQGYKTPPDGNSSNFVSYEHLDFESQITLKLSSLVTTTYYATFVYRVPGKGNVTQEENISVGTPSFIIKYLVPPGSTLPGGSGGSSN